MAVAWYRRALKGGEVLAGVWLAECHEHGEGVRRDPVAALAYYEAAAATGDAHAMAELGRCLLYGIGQRADRRRGEYWLRRAADCDWPEALGELERYWFDRAEHLLRESRGAGDATSPAAVEAVGLYRLAAELGHRQAALRYGFCLRDGWGTAADATAARTWLLKAAALADAKLALADLLYFGIGGARDPGAALHWYELAARQTEDPYAHYSLGYCLLHGEGRAADPRAGLRWLRRAAGAGNGDAAYELGLVYLQGKGVAASSRLGLGWLRKAASLGSLPAARILTEVAS
jgi:TPR repeat protein